MYCGIPHKDYNNVRPIIWARNRRILRVTSILTAVVGSILLVINVFREINLGPYIILIAGSILIFIIAMTLGRKFKNAYFSFALCYGQMVLTVVYSVLLAAEPRNASIPATSVVVFIALLPFTIDDRPIRMYAYMLSECAGYLIISYFAKTNNAFTLDLLNCICFTVLGAIVYSLVCSRNVKELSHGLRIENIQNNLISSLAAAVEERDEDTGGHIARTEQYVSMLIEKIKKKEKYGKRSHLYYRNVVMAAPIHDLGKIKISDTILNKPGKLTPEEYEIMKKHTIYGEQVIRSSLRSVDDENYVNVAINIAKYHHERWDGTGYPEGLKGEEIPLEARIMALADVYDALRSKRPYKEAFSVEKSIEIMREGIGTQFDPELASIFIDIVQEQEAK